MNAYNDPIDRKLKALTSCVFDERAFVLAFALRERYDDIELKAFTSKARGKTKRTERIS